MATEIGGAGGGISAPIVALNRWTLVVGIVGGLALRQPLVTTVLFVIILGAALFGRRGSLVFQVGRCLLARPNAAARRAGRVEDPRLMRFNNAIAATLLGLAQLAFLAGQPVLGWACALLVALAAGVALAGFCLGCFLYYQFHLQRSRLFDGR